MMDPSIDSILNALVGIQTQIDQLKMEIRDAGSERAVSDEFRDDDREHVPEYALGGVADDSGAFRFDGGSITHCNFMFGRTLYSLSDVENVTDGRWCLVVPHSNPGGATVQVSSASSSDTQTVVPLFTISGGEVVTDFRGMPSIAVYED